LNPSYSSAHQWYAEYLAAMGRLDQAIEEVKKAQQLDLLSPMMNFDLGEKFYYSRRYDLAIEQLRETLDLEPELAIARYVLGMAYIQKSMFDEAIIELQKAVATSEGRPWFKAGLGFAYGLSGEANKALEILDEMKKPPSQQYVSPFDLASVFLGLGETERALDELTAAYEDGTYITLFLKVDPQFDPLRGDPRYQDLLRRMNLPDQPHIFGSYPRFGLNHLSASFFEMPFLRA
jgi:tetratricopeptide (TPR) repeat protein